jgi:hypothetical protein
VFFEAKTCAGLIHGLPVCAKKARRTGKNTLRTRFADVI